jgi:hypothetical protein
VTDQVIEVTHEVAPARSAPLPPPPLAVPNPGSAGAVQRVEGFVNRAAALSAYRLRRVGPAGAAGIVLFIGAVSLFMASNLPQVRAVSSLQSQIAHTAHVSSTAPVTADGAPLSELPARADAPAIVGKVLEQARASGIDLERGQYEFVAARDGVAARYRMTFPVHTSYVNLRHFMDQTLIALPAVAVEALRVERKSVGDDSVDAELRLSAYVRSDP